MLVKEMENLVKLGETQQVEAFLTALDHFYENVTETLQQLQLPRESQRENESLQQQQQQQSPPPRPSSSSSSSTLMNPRADFLRLIGRTLAALDFPLVLDGLYLPLLREKGVGLRAILKLLRLFHLTAPVSKTTRQAIAASALVERCFLFLDCAIGIVSQDVGGGGDGRGGEGSGRGGGGGSASGGAEDRLPGKENSAITKTTVDLIYEGVHPTSADLEEEEEEEMEEVEPVSETGLLVTACEDLAYEMPEAHRSFDSHSLPAAKSAKELIHRLADLLLTLGQGEQAAKPALIQPHLAALRDHARRCYVALKDRMESLALYRVFIQAADKAEVEEAFFGHEPNEIDVAFFRCLSPGLVAKCSLEEFQHEVEAKLKVLNGLIPAGLAAMEEGRAEGFRVETMITLYREVLMATSWEESKELCLWGLWRIACHDEAQKTIVSHVFSSFETPPCFLTEEARRVFDGFQFRLGHGRFHQYQQEMQSKLKPGEAERKQRMNNLKELVQTEQKYVAEAQIVVEDYGVKIQAAFTARAGGDGQAGNRKKKELLSNYEQILKFHQLHILRPLQEWMENLLMETQNVDEEEKKMLEEEEMIVCVDTMCKTFETRAEEMTKMYTTYCRNMNHAGNVVQANYETLADIAKEIAEEKKALGAAAEVFPFDFYVSKPFQRITKYPLLFDNILKQTRKLVAHGLEVKKEDVALMEKLVGVVKSIPAKVNFRMNMDRIQFPPPNKTTDEKVIKRENDKRKRTWGGLLDMSSLHCSKPNLAKDALLEFMKERPGHPESKTWKKLKSVALEKKIGLIAERAIVLCEKRSDEKAPLKFDFDVLSNQNFHFSSMKDVDDEDWHVVITWKPVAKETHHHFIVIKLATQGHFQIWVDQLERIKNTISEMGRGLADPLSHAGGALVAEPRLIMSGSTRRESAVGEEIRAKYASTASLIVAKPAFDYDVVILYDKDVIPVAMTLFDALRKEGHVIFVEIGADRWNGTPDLNQAAFDMQRAEQLVSFISPALVEENLFFQTEVLFAAETGKNFTLFPTDDQTPWPTWIQKVAARRSNVLIPAITLAHPGDVLAQLEVIFDTLRLRLDAKPRAASPKNWTKADLAQWLEESELTELATFFPSGKEVDALAREWRQSPRVMREWTLAEMRGKCASDEKAEELLIRFQSALRKLYPELNG